MTHDTRPTLAHRLWPLLEAELFPRPGDARTFNPWRDEDPELDVAGAPARRRANLRAYLESFDNPPPVLLVGEAPSWRGCRFSGIAFTAEAQLGDDGFPVDGRRTSAFRERPLSEPSATLVWGALQLRFPGFLLWNALPFHPHPDGEPLANRTPGKREVDGFADLLHGVLEEVAPRTVVAVGRTGEGALERLGVPCTYVRHPAQGGARKFRDGIERIFGGTHGAQDGAGA